MPRYSQIYRTNHGRFSLALASESVWNKKAQRSLNTSHVASSKCTWLHHVHGADHTNHKQSNGESRDRAVRAPRFAFDDERFDQLRYRDVSFAAPPPPPPPPQRRSWRLVHRRQSSIHHLFEYSIFYFSIWIFVQEILFEYIRIFESSFQHCKKARIRKRGFIQAKFPRCNSFLAMPLFVLKYRDDQKLTLSKVFFLLY